MPTCTNPSCGQTFDEKENGPEECRYHSGGPVFHEGSKSWSCCKEVNKPVLEFDEFMKIPGCTKGPHSSVKKAAPAPLPSPNVPSPSNANIPISTDSTATTTTTATASTSTSSLTSALSSTTLTPASKPASKVSSSSITKPTTKTPPEKIDWTANEIVDDLSKEVEVGRRCKRRGCGGEWVGGKGGGLRGRRMEGKRMEGRERARGRGPIFHEGSKGYLCCKPRFLDFNDFLSHPGCRLTSTHQFFDPPAKVKVGEDGQLVEEEERVDCRVDWYQTPGGVMVSCFAKQVDKDASSITLHETHIDLDLRLPNNRRCVKVIELWESINVEESKVKVLGTKIDLNLIKSTPASWPLLTKPAEGTTLPPGYAITFGVKGRTGTVGGKEMVLS